MELILEIWDKEDKKGELRSLSIRPAAGVFDYLNALRTVDYSPTFIS